MTVWAWSRRAEVEPCNATELLLRSGRVAGRVDATPADDGLEDVGHRLSVALVALGPHRESRDERLRRAYRCVHDAMGDLATVLLQVSAPSPRARPARPARRRRPWGARS
ncbi:MULTISPECIES: hypothetical protein [unclassified Nocardioides]|uniref:hypothetical protein n=1 Tax=unclassified Nocardioides TaxID=2615069 RepID=UPI003014E74E